MCLHRQTAKLQDEMRTIQTSYPVKESALKAIKERILSEHRKYSSKHEMDWAMLAAMKIYGSFVEKKELNRQGKTPYDLNRAGFRNVRPE